MRVRSQINLLVIILLLSIGLITVGLFVANTVAARVDNLELAVSQALQDVYRLTSINKDLMVTEMPLDQVIDGWKTAIEDLDEALTALPDHPGTAYISDSVGESLERTLSVWSLSLSRLETARESFDLLIESDSIHDFRKTGLIELAAYLEEEEQVATLLFQVEQLTRDLESFDLSARDLVVGNLQEVAGAVAIQADTIRTTGRRAILLLTVIVVVGSFVFVYLFGRSLSRRVGAIENVMERVAAQDMTVRAATSGNDEIAGLGRYLDKGLDVIAAFISSVRRAVTENDELKDGLSSGSAESASAVNEISHNIDSIRTEFDRLNGRIEQSSIAVGDIDTKIKSLNHDISQQNTIIEDSTASYEQMDSSIQQVAQLSVDRREAAESLVQVILDGGEKITTTNSVIDSVTAEVDDILEIIEIINAVAEQTNLLSMNAAIESAHAGEAGKGFAVVAEEIRKLAESTSENASKIDRLLKSITGKIGEAVDASRAGADTFETIRKDVGLFREAMHEIVENMQTLSEGSASIVGTTQRLSEITGSVTDAAGTIAANTDQINAAMGDASNMSSSIANGIKEIDIGAKEILTAITDISRLSDENRERMQELAELIDRFDLADEQSDKQSVDTPGQSTGVTEAE
ncbi:MAG: HAMP domain-containing methyl-accepting chemotaxis protein [Spirochaeta sp.]|nr:HAMP domain-containing methyl-accepting chemotaxis protein [Spirochaeta sp.]